MDLALDQETPAGTEGLASALENLSDDLADRLAHLASRSCDVSVNVVQEFDDDQGTTGLHLTREAIRWMARAKADLDVDQYVLVE